jgi:hypothetical protein
MRKFLSFVFALTVTVAVAVPISSAHADCIAVPGLPASGTGCAFSYPPSSGGGTSLSLDGSASFGSASGISLTTGTVTTTAGSGLMICDVATNAASISSITGTGLTFTRRAQQTPTNGPTDIEEWSAPYTSNYSGAITINSSSATSTYIGGSCFGIGDAATTSSFDTNASLPGKSSSGVAAISTSSAKDFIHAIIALSTTTGSAGSGWTGIPGSGTDFVVVEYMIVSATQSSLSATLTTGGPAAGSITDAVVSQ